jgi:hypothetical protein
MILLAVVACAQPKSAYADREATSSLTAGLGFAGGASISLDAPELWKVSPVFAWRANVDISYPLTPVIGASLSLGIDQRGTKVYWYEDKTMWDERIVDYFHITPGFTFSSFYLGVSIGIPTAGVRRWQDFSDGPEMQTELDKDVNKLATMIEPRIGAVVPLMDEEIGWLGLTVSAGYNVSDLSESSTFFPGAFAKQNIGSQTASMHLGLTWQFVIPGTSRKRNDR